METKCPTCQSEYIYEDGTIWICPMCSWEGSLDTVQDDVKVFKDANGNILQDGDSVVVIKDLKVKGSSQPLKQGTKVKSIRLVDSDHDIECRIDGFGAMQLKTEFVKKV